MPTVAPRLLLIAPAFVAFFFTALLIGVLATRWDSWGAATKPTAIFPLLALVLIFLFLPETNGKELEETASMGH